MSSFVGICASCKEEIRKPADYLVSVSGWAKPPGTTGRMWMRASRRRRVAHRLCVERREIELKSKPKSEQQSMLM